MCCASRYPSAVPGFRGCEFVNAAAEYSDVPDPARAVAVSQRAWIVDVTEEVCSPGSSHPRPRELAQVLLMLRTPIWGHGGGPGCRGRGSPLTPGGITADAPSYRPRRQWRSQGGTRWLRWRRRWPGPSGLDWATCSWLRHANPWRTSTRASRARPPSSRRSGTHAWIGWWSLLPLGVVCGWLAINPRVFAPPRRWTTGLSRAVLGERFWADRTEIPVPARPGLPERPDRDLRSRAAVHRLGPGLARRVDHLVRVGRPHGREEPVPRPHGPAPRRHGGGRPSRRRPGRGCAWAGRGRPR